MTTKNTLLFIDANIYLDIYRLKDGSLLLAALGEQAKHIFVTQQAVDEVQRNKLKATADFLARHFVEVKANTFALPDHFCGTTSEQIGNIRKKMKGVSKAVNQINKEVDSLRSAILEEVSQSKDDVSKALAPIFQHATPYKAEEMERARKRKELGNPPGKKTDPIGDELTWEQILSNLKGKKSLWLITKDTDYGIDCDGKLLMNPFLQQEVRRANKDVETFLFADLIAGLKHFTEKTGATGDKLPTEEQAEEIKKEERALPPLDAPTTLWQKYATSLNVSRPSLAIDLHSSKPAFIEVTDTLSIAEIIEMARQGLDVQLYSLTRRPTDPVVMPPSIQLPTKPFGIGTDPATTKPKATNKKDDGKNE